MIRVVNVEKTGTGKTHDTIKWAKKTIAETDYNTLIVTPDIKGAKLFAEEIGEGAEYFESEKQKDVHGKRTKYRHHLRLGKFEHCRVVIITHAKYQSIFANNGDIGNAGESVAGVLQDMMHYEVIDEYLAPHQSLTFSQDSLFRLYHYYNFKSHTIDIMIQKLRGDKPRKIPHIDLDQLKKEVDKWLAKYPYFRNHTFKIKRTKKQYKKALKKFGYEKDHKIGKKKDECDPTEYERDIINFVQYADTKVISPDSTIAKGAIVGKRLAESNIPKRMMLDATYELLAPIQKRRDIIAPTKNRTYKNTTVHNMKFRGNNSHIKSRISQVLKSKLLLKGKTLIVGRKSDLDAKVKKGSELTYREMLEKAGYYVTHFGADKGTNDYKDAVNVVILQLPQYPMFLALAKEFIHGGKVAGNELFALLIQIINRGTCRMGDNDMMIILPKMLDGFQDVLEKAMPQIKIAGNKIQAIEDAIKNNNDEVIVLSKLNIVGFERPKSLAEYYSQNKEDCNKLFKKYRRSYKYGKAIKEQL